MCWSVDGCCVGLGVGGGEERVDGGVDDGRVRAGCGLGWNGCCTLVVIVWAVMCMWCCGWAWVWWCACCVGVRDMGGGGAGVCVWDGWVVCGVCGLREDVGGCMGEDGGLCGACGSRVGGVALVDGEGLRVW